MAGKKGSKLMNEEYFNEIKKLLEANVPTKYVEAITKRSSYTVRLVSKSETYQDYQQYNRDRFRANLAVEKSPEPVADSTVTDRLITIENTLNQLLNIFQEKESRANVAFWKR